MNASLLSLCRRGTPVGNAVATYLPATHERLKAPSPPYSLQGTMSHSTSFPNISFAGQLRPSQSGVVSIARKQLDSGSRRLHVVAPPGSGKKVLGLYLWAEIIKRPCLVLSPNSAIQSQWAARVDLFESSLSGDELVSTDPLNPAWLTSLTYQSVTMPARGQVELEEQARQLWVEKLSLIHI